MSSIFNQKKIKIFSIILILILGGYLRFHGLENQSLWNDELSSWTRSNYGSICEVIIKGAIPDVHPPGFHIILFISQKILGSTEFLLRVPSAIAGTLSIVVIFLVGEKLYSYKEGLISASLMAILWLPIYYSQEVRAYSFLLLFTLLEVYSGLLLIQNLQKKDKFPFKVSMIFILISIILSYLHYFGLLFVFLQGIFLISVHYKNRQPLIYLIVIYFIIFLAYLPWIPIMITQFNYGGGAWILKPDILRLPEYIKFIFNKSDLMITAVLILYSSLFASQYFISYGNDYSTKTVSATISSTLVLLIWLSVPFIISYLFSIFFKSILTNRNLIIIAPAAYILLARSITQIRIKNGGKIILTIIMIVFLLYQLLFGMDYYHHKTKEQFREAVKYVVDNSEQYSNDKIFVYGYNDEYFNYYFKSMQVDKKADLLVGEAKDSLLVSTYILKNDARYFWYISAHRTPDKKLIEYFNKKYKLVQNRFFIKAIVWLYKVI